MYVSDIRIAFAGIGNCTSALVQGIFYYNKLKVKKGEIIPGLIHSELGGYKVSDLKPVVAFDVDKRKVGKDLSKAIWAPPNCTMKFFEVPYLNVEVLKGPVLDGVSEHLRRYVKISPEKEITKVDRVAEILKENKVDVLVNNIPTGSERASWFYAESALRAGSGFVNGIPVLIANNEEFAKRAEENKVPIVGDDYKSQVGGTILNRDLIHMFVQRGVKVVKFYQLNYGGDTDFWNLTEWERGKSKHASKKRGVDAVMPYEAPFSVNVSHLKILDNDKICRIEIEGENFGGTPITLEAKLRVVDAPNSAGVAVDAIRCCKIAKDRRVGGVLESASSYLMKSAPKQHPSEEEAKKAMEEFIEEKRER